MGKTEKVARIGWQKKESLDPLDSGSSSFEKTHQSLILPVSGDGQGCWDESSNACGISTSLGIKTEDAERGEPNSGRRNRPEYNLAPKLHSIQTRANEPSRNIGYRELMVEIRIGRGSPPRTTNPCKQGRSQDLVSGGPHPFRGGGGARPPIFRLRPQITRVPPYVLLATPGFRGGGGRAPPRPPSGYALACK